MEMNFCRRCGKPLEHIRDHAYKCSEGHTIYANGAPGVCVFFVSADNQKVLLATRALEPHKGMLDGVGGFLDASEGFEDAATRELAEELGLSAADYEPLRYLSSGYDVYPYQDEPVPFVGVAFWSRLITTEPLQPMDDIAAVDWYDLRNMDLNQLHTEDIRIGVRALQHMFLGNQTAKEA